MTSSLLMWISSLAGGALFTAGGYFLGLTRREELPADPQPEPAPPPQPESEPEPAPSRTEDESPLKADNDRLRGEVDALATERDMLKAELERVTRAADELRGRERERVTGRPPPPPAYDLAQLEALRAELAQARADAAALRRRANSIPPSLARAVSHAQATEASDRSLRDTAERLLRSRLEEAVAGRERAEASLREAQAELKIARARLEVSTPHPAPVGGADAELASPPDASDREELLSWLRSLLEARVAGSFVVLDDESHVVAGAGPDSNLLASWTVALRKVSPALEKPSLLGQNVALTVRGDAKRSVVSWAFPTLLVTAAVVTR